MADGPLLDPDVLTSPEFKHGSYYDTTGGFGGRASRLWNEARHRMSEGQLKRLREKLHEEEMALAEKQGDLRWDPEGREWIGPKGVRVPEGQLASRLEFTGGTLIAPEQKLMTMTPEQRQAEAQALRQKYAAPEGAFGEPTTMLGGSAGGMRPAVDAFKGRTGAAVVDAIAQGLMVDDAGEVVNQEGKRLTWNSSAKRWE